MFYKIENEKVSIRVKAQPSASKNEFCGLYGEDALKIRIKAAPVEGASKQRTNKVSLKKF